MGPEDLPTPEHEDMAPKNTPAEKQAALQKSKEVHVAMSKIWAKVSANGGRALEINVPGKGTLQFYMRSAPATGSGLLFVREKSTGKMHTFSYEGNAFVLDYSPSSDGDDFGTIGSSKRLYFYNGDKTPPQVGGVANGAKLYSNYATRVLGWISAHVR